MSRSHLSLVLTPRDAANFLDDQIYLTSIKGAPTLLPEGKVATEVKNQLAKLASLPMKITVNESREAILKHYKQIEQIVEDLPLIKWVAEVCQAANHPPLLAFRSRFITEMGDALYKVANARAEQQGGWVQLCSQEIQQAQDIKAAKVEEIARARIRMEEKSRNRREALLRERSVFYTVFSSVSTLFSEQRGTVSSNVSPYAGSQNYKT